MALDLLFPLFSRCTHCVSKVEASERVVCKLNGSEAREATPFELPRHVLRTVVYTHSGCKDDTFVDTNPVRTIIRSQCKELL